MSNLDDWPSSQQLIELFPAAYTPTTPRRAGWTTNPKLGQHRSQRLELHKRPLKTRSRMILTLEMRGKTTAEIAQQLGIKPNTVTRVTRTDRYIEAREVLLGRMDSEFMAMKPAAFAAIGNCLRSKDDNTALRASEAWMRAAGFGQYGKGNAQQGVTAYDVARELLQVNVNVSVDGDRRAPKTDPADG